jgi:uncharacterized Zn finger protein
MSDLPPCPNCHSSDVKVLRKHAIVNILICNQCGTHYSDNPEPPPSDAVC